MSSSRPDARRLWLLRALMFFQSSVVVLARVVAYSHLLQVAGSGALPKIYVAQATLVAILTLSMLGLVDRAGRAALLGRMFIVFALGLFGLAAMPDSAALIVAPAQLLMTEAFIALTGSHYWLMSTELLTPEQARRYFPSLTLAGGAGAVLGGLGAHLATSIGTRGVTLLGIAPTLISAGLCAAIGYRYAHRVGPTAQAKPGPGAETAEANRPGAALRDGMALVRESPLLRWVGLLNAILTVTAVTIDYLFNNEAVRRGAAHLPAVIGNTNIAVSIGEFLIVGVLGGRLLTTFGLMRTFKSYPVGGATLALGGLALGSAWPPILLKIFDRLENYTIMNPGLGIALNAFPKTRRGRAGLVYAGLIKPIAMASAGLGLLALHAQPVVLWAIVGTCFLLFLMVVNRIAHVYRDTLVDNLRLQDAQLVAVSIQALAEPENRSVVPRLLEFLEKNDDPILAENLLRAAGGIRDPRFVPALLRALAADNTSLKIAAVASLGAFTGDEIRDALLRTLKGESSARVKSSIMAALGRGGMPWIHPVLLAGLTDKEPRVRANAIESIGLSGDPSLIAELRPLLLTESPRGLANVIVALARVPNERPGALAALHRILSGDDRSLFASALWAVGEVGDVESLATTHRLAEDDDSMIRRNALIALGKMEQPGAAEPLVDLLLHGAQDDAQAVARGFDRLPSGVRDGILSRLGRMPRVDRAPAIAAFTSCGLNYADELDRLGSPTVQRDVVRFW